MFVYNPVGFEPQLYLPAGLHPYADCARVLVHLVECGRVFNRLHDDDFVPRKAAYLRNLVHKERYLDIRNALVDSKVIDLHPQYVIGKRSFGFRIGERFRDSLFKRFKITDVAAMCRLQRFRSVQSPLLEDPTHLGLQTWLQRLEVDYKAGIDFLESSKLSKSKFRAKHLSLSMLQDKEYFFKPDAQGRVHTNLTNLSSDLRAFLHYNGESLVNIDIGNSQPLFFGLEVLHYYNMKYITNNTYKKTPSLLPPFHYDAEGVISKSSIHMPDDLRSYLRSTEQAQFYEIMMKALDVPLHKRKHFKQDFFRKVFYCKTNYFTKERNAFKSLFPTVLEHILHLKKDDPRNAPLALQRAESNFVIGTVCKRILKESADVPLWTIHDSIVSTKKFGDYALSVMMDEFVKLRIKPRLRIECFEMSHFRDVSIGYGRSKKTLEEITTNGLSQASN